MYMTPEEAAYGLDLFNSYVKNHSDGSYKDCTYSSKYIDISNFSFLTKAL